ncbi:MAG: CBS domain-containing protein [Kofleriaceae bacterium]
MTTSPFAAPVTSVMTTEVVYVRTQTPIDDVAARLASRRISSVPVLDDAGSIVGVVSRTDLIRAGRLGVGGRAVAPLPEPAPRTAEVMSQGPLMVTPETTLAEAARLMLEHGVHRVYVVDARGRLGGVVAAVDLARAVRDARVTLPLEALMTSPIQTIDVGAPVADGVARLAALHVIALIVTEDGWPIGTFSQVEALAARDLPATTPIDAVYDPALICLPATTRAPRRRSHRTARRAPRGGRARARGGGHRHRARLRPGGGRRAHLIASGREVERAERERRRAVIAAARDHLAAAPRVGQERQRVAAEPAAAHPPRRPGAGEVGELDGGEHAAGARIELEPARGEHLEPRNAADRERRPRRGAGGDDELAHATVGGDAAARRLVAIERERGDAAALDQREGRHRGAVVGDGRRRQAEVPRAVAADDQRLGDGGGAWRELVAGTHPRQASAGADAVDLIDEHLPRPELAEPADQGGGVDDDLVAPGASAVAWPRPRSSATAARAAAARSRPARVRAAVASPADVAPAATVARTTAAVERHASPGPPSTTTRSAW